MDSKRKRSGTKTAPRKQGLSSTKSSHTLYWIACIVFLLDRISKTLVVWNVTSPIDLGLFSIIYSTNTGVTWGLLKGYPLIPIIVSFIVIGAIVYYQKTLSHVHKIIAGLVLGAALGNLLDRLLYGAVIDWIDFGWWPVFNVADSAIVIAMIWIVWDSFSEK